YFQEMEIANLDIVKIDVEGFEKKVLFGMQDVLKIERPIIVFEASYGNELSFGSVQQLNEALPENYQLFTFNTRKPDGRKARKRGAKAKKTGTYQLIPLIDWRASGQDNIIACPEEKQRILPMQSTGRITVP
ncbi:MAG: FkbM family methyltransferase, partial [Pseudomonadota bacterium]|nr:FkbM family methyltransferase [Pseudomonadota bacterium]